MYSIFYDVQEMPYPDEGRKTDVSQAAKVDLPSVWFSEVSIAQESWKK
jgi:hypothetical protein